MTALRALACLALAALPAGCCSIDAKAREEWLAAQPKCPEFRRAQAEIRIESPQFHGDFTAVLLVRTEPIAVRLQLFPDIGGKVLDLAATRTTQHGVMPQTGAVHAVPGGPDDRLLGMFATTLLELNAPVQSREIRCIQRTRSGDVDVLLHDRFGAHCSIATTERKNRYVFSRRSVKWFLHRESERKLVVEGKRFRMTIEVTEQEFPTTLAPALFELPAR